VPPICKSLGNYVALEEPPEDMYGKIMSLPDELIGPYFEYLTDVSTEELAEMDQAMESEAVNPMEFKKRLAHCITTEFHDLQAADSAQHRFERVVQRQDLPEDMPQFSMTELAGPRWSNILVSAGLAPSVAEGKRLISQGAVEIFPPSGLSRRLSEDAQYEEPAPGTAIKVGRRRFARLTRP
jgi:tyrosyl-tRNA synthetase